MTFNPNTSLPSLSRPYRSPPKYTTHSPPPYPLLDLQQIQQQQFYISKLRQQRQRMQLFREEFDRKDHRIRELEGEIERIRGSDKEEEYLRRIQLLECQNGNLQREKEELSINVRVYKSEIFSLKQEIHGLGEQIAEKEGECQALRYQLTRQHQSYLNLQQHFTCIEREHERQVRDLQDNIEGWRRRTEEIRRELDSIKKQNTLLRNRNSEYQLQFQKHRHQLQALTLQNDNLKQQVQGDKEQLNRAIGVLNSYKSVSDLRETEHFHEIKHVKKVEEKMNKLRIINKSYKKRIQQHDICIRKYEQDLRDLNIKMRGLQQEFSKQQEIVLGYTVLERRYLEEVERLKKQVKRSKGKKGEGDKDREEGKLRGELERLRGELGRMRGEQVEKMEKVVRAFERRERGSDQ